MPPTSIFLLVSLLVCTVALLVQRIGFAKRTRPGPYAAPRGSAAAGIFYSFTKAWAPWSKESAMRHLPSYVAGVVFHLAIFAMLAMLVAGLFPFPLPRPLGFALAALFGIGISCGLALLIKRFSLPAMRAISVPEDFFANLLVNGALAAAMLAALQPGAVPAFQVASALMLLWAPLGKLRHMLFLLTSRWYWGEFFGRRGVKPHAKTVGAPRG